MNKTTNKLTPEEVKENNYFLLAVILLSIFGAIGIVIFALAKPKPGRLKRALTIAVTFTVFYVILIVIALYNNTAKNRNTVQSTPAVEITIDKACDLTNDKKNLTTEGFFHTPKSVFCYSSCGMDFGNKPKESTLPLQIAVSKINLVNTMDSVGQLFTEDGLTIRDKAGDIVDYTKQYKITGTMSATKDTKTDKVNCSLKVSTIEKSK